MPWHRVIFDGPSRNFQFTGPFEKSVILTVIHTFNRKKTHIYILHDHEPNSICSSQMHKRKYMDRLDWFNPHTIQSDTALI